MIETREEGRDVGRPRLDALLDELGADSTSAGTREFDAFGGDAFFTARVLDALPEPLRWTGASPLTRVATLLGFHAAAAVVGVLVYRWASPRLFEQISEQVAGMAAARPEGASVWAASGALVLGSDGSSSALTMVCVVLVVLLVGLVAFWATRSHTRAT